MKRLLIIGAFFLVTAQTAFAQLNFMFMPEINARTVDGLGNFQMQNLSGKLLVGYIQIAVRDARTKMDVLLIKIPVVGINTGLMAFPRTSFATSRFVFANNDVASLTNQTRSFPVGEYTICYHFFPSDKIAGDEYENCFDASIQPLVPISLVNPSDKDSICQKRPVLSWNPPMPFNLAMRFRLLLTEKKGGESVENLLINAPIVLLDNISTTTINYPSVSPDLKEGKTYCWQVIAYQKGIIISKSEIWEFTVQCKNPETIKPNDSYRELKSLVNGNYYIANRFLKFSFTNSYHVKKLVYKLIAIENGLTEIKNIPEIAIKPGLNNIDIDLTDLGLVAGKHYLLKVYPFNEANVEVRFIYQDKEEEENE